MWLEVQSWIPTDFETVEVGFGNSSSESVDAPTVDPWSPIQRFGFAPALATGGVRAATFADLVEAASNHLRVLDTQVEVQQVQ